VVEGEGVTTVSRTLAAMIAHDLEANVCWVDLNFTDDSRGAPLSDHASLADVLSERATIESALEPTSNPRLALLNAGTVARSRRPVLARSPLLTDLFAALDQTFQYVVMDVPPLLASSEALNLVRHARAYLMVVGHGSTTVPQVRRTAQELRSIPSLGVVLNRFQPNMPKRLLRLFAE
jgi:polysaccharide biosynthesis transport protein